MSQTREQLYNAVKSQLEPGIFKHSLALEACMGKIYDFLSNENRLDDNEPKKEDWTNAGLIHDIDYSEDFKADHPTKTREVLAKYNLAISNELHDIVRAHAPKISGREPSNKAEWAIYCADSLTGLITACALVYPSRKIADVKSSSVLKRFLKEPKFAAGTRRDEVILCEKEDGLNIPLSKFIEICLSAMQKIANDIEL